MNLGLGWKRDRRAVRTRGEREHRRGIDDTATGASAMANTAPGASQPVVACTVLFSLGFFSSSVNCTSFPPFSCNLSSVCSHLFVLAVVFQLSTCPPILGCNIVWSMWSCEICRLQTFFFNYGCLVPGSYCCFEALNYSSQPGSDFCIFCRP